LVEVTREEVVDIVGASGALGASGAEGGVGTVISAQTIVVLVRSRLTIVKVVIDFLSLNKFTYSFPTFDTPSVGKIIF
jgi:hypothetical protein